MITLNDFYNNGVCELPSPGRYTVSVKIHGIFKIVLEKQIKNGRGANYLPVFGLRWFSIPNMGFKIELQSSEVRFVYDNNVLVDTLRKVDYGKFLGKIYYKEKFIDYFFLAKI